MELQGLDYEPAKQFLLEKSSLPTEMLEEINLNYTLEWCEFMQQNGLDKEVCEKLEIGRPKGQTKLSGCVAFAVYNENKKKVAYVGIKIGTGKLIIPKQFNPETTLFNLCNVDPDNEVILVRDIMDCAKLLSNCKPAICNFGLPYLSRKQLDLLQTLTYLSLQGFGNHTNEIAINLANLHGGYFRFI